MDTEISLDMAWGLEKSGSFLAKLEEPYCEMVRYLCKYAKDRPTEKGYKKPIITPNANTDHKIECHPLKIITTPLQSIKSLHLKKTPTRGTFMHHNFPMSFCF